MCIISELGVFIISELGVFIIIELGVFIIRKLGVFIFSELGVFIIREFGVAMFSKFGVCALDGIRIPWRSKLGVLGMTLFLDIGVHGIIAFSSQYIYGGSSFIPILFSSNSSIIQINKILIK